MINHESVIIEGFGSIINQTEFKLNRKGLNVIRGKTGAGKTTIPSSLTWCWFGTTLKGKATVQTWEEIRPKDFKGTMVRSSFNKDGVNYEIIRCISYKKTVFGKTKGGSNLFILKEGIPIESERNKTDKQKFIENLLGYSFDLFTNSIIFGQKLKRIIEESGPNKKKIFDEAFEVLFIDEAKKKTEKERDKVNGSLKDIESEYDHISKLVEDAIENYEDALDFEKKFEKNREKNLGKLSENKSNITKKLDKLKVEISKQKIDEAKGLKDKLSEIERKIEKSEKSNQRLIKLERDINYLVKSIADKEKELKNIKNGECPLCKSEITSKKTSHLRDDIKTVIKDLKVDLVNLRNKRENTFEIDMKHLNKDMGKLQEKLGKIKEKEKNLKNLKISESNYIDELNSIKADIKELNNEKLVIKSPKYKEKISKYKKKSKKLAKEMKLLTKKNDIYNWLIKDPLSNNGLKAYIFDSLLSKVNEKLWDLQKHLGFRVEFGIDLESSRKDFYQAIYKDDMIILYTDLSGGQKQLVDFSVALAIHKVISSIRPMNIIFFDEPFEGLDVDCVDIISELISEEASDKCLYMITHHPNFNPITSNNIHFELDKNGATKIN
jgi:DNA repair exonuclease SbcCD ATPase subunit